MRVSLIGVLDYVALHSLHSENISQLQYIKCIYDLVLKTPNAKALFDIYILDLFMVDPKEKGNRGWFMNHTLY